MNREQNFFDNLMERPQSFLRALHERRSMTVEDVVNHMDLRSKRDVGRITGAIGRWAPVRGVSTPFRRDGDRIEWVGNEEWQQVMEASK